ncbi:hypothetical protein AB9U01_25515 [Pseudomonas qingdaonensis]|uniref:hypothetical protein n=1 Tax=Pseudomonas qingdaonensis TaxID=2056231 RepID=UPI0035158B62
MAYDTNNPVGSTDPRDLYDNAGNLDKFVNGDAPFYPDRLGKQRISWSGMEADFSNAQEGREAAFDQFLEASAFIWIGDYGAGLTFTSRSQYMVRDGNAYRLAVSTTIPYTSTGNWALEQTKFSLVNSDDILRQDLNSPEGGTIVRLSNGKTVEETLIGGPISYASQFQPEIVDAATFQAFLNSGVGKRLVIDIPVTVTKAGLESLPLYGLSIPAKTVAQWIDGAWTKLEPGVQVRHIFAASGAANSDVVFLNPQIDGQDSSANGIGGANAATTRLSNVWVVGGVIKNIARERVRDSFEGGSGVTFQYGADNCGVTRTKFYRVNCPTDASGRSNVVSYGAQRTYNITFDSIHCEQCEMIGHSYDLFTLSSVTTELNAVARWSNITFLNCGRSNIVGSWPGLSFTRVNAAGNGSPWTDINIPTTSYSGNWEPSAYSAADPEWAQATASYAVGSRVKVTNDGTLSALFHFEGNAGCVIDGVNGYNEASFGQIGALIAGAAGGCVSRSFDVLVDTKAGVHGGAVPNMWPVVTRKDRSWVDSDFEFSNIGTTVRVVTADAPGAGDATPYRQRGLKVNCVVRRSTVTELLDSRVGGAADPWRNRLEVTDCAGAGGVSGTFGFIYNAQNTVPTGNGESTFNRVRCEPLLIKTHQNNAQLGIERTGTGAGSVQFYPLGSELHIGTTSTLTFDATGQSSLKMKRLDGTAVTVTINNSNQLVVS